jgi:hypothetical protein
LTAEPAGPRAGQKKKPETRLYRVGLIFSADFAKNGKNRQKRTKKPIFRCKSTFSPMNTGASSYKKYGGLAL